MTLIFQIAEQLPFFIYKNYVKKYLTQWEKIVKLTPQKQITQNPDIFDEENISRT